MAYSLIVCSIMITNNNEETNEIGAGESQSRASAFAGGLPKKPHPMEALLKNFSANVFLKPNDIVEGTVSLFPRSSQAIGQLSKDSARGNRAVVGEA